MTSRSANSASTASNSDGALARSSLDPHPFAGERSTILRQLGVGAPPPEPARALVLQLRLADSITLLTARSAEPRPRFARQMDLMALGRARSLRMQALHRAHEVERLAGSSLCPWHGANGSTFGIRATLVSDRRNIAACHLLPEPSCRRAGTPEICQAPERSLFGRPDTICSIHLTGCVGRSNTLCSAGQQHSVRYPLTTWGAGAYHGIGRPSSPIVAVGHARRRCYPCRYLLGVGVGCGGFRLAGSRRRRQSNDRLDSC